MVYEQRIKFMKAWADHVVYTRDVIIAILSSSTEVNDASARLLTNQDDIGDLFRPYYPSEDVNQLVTLLKEHITVAATIVQFAATGQITTGLETQWRTNGNNIVNQLIAINPLLEKSALRTMWQDHLTLTLEEVKFRINKNWTSDILTFDKILSHMYRLSDLLADSIAEQHPLKFCTITSEPTHG